MNIETLCPPGEDLPNPLKTSSELAEQAIKTRFGPSLGIKRTVDSLDRPITIAEVLKAQTLIKPTRVVEVKITPQVFEAVIKKPEHPIVTTNQSEKLHTGHLEEGQLFVCDVSLYRNLYNEYMEFSGGDREMARRNVLLAITKDSTSLIQENISALTERDKYGKEVRVVDDDLIQAKLQQTPTQHEFYEKVNSKGETILCSPEHLELEKDYTTTITRFRRGNDLAVAHLRKELVLNGSAGEIVYNASPRADNEGPLVEQCAGEYGYGYWGEISLVEQATLKDISVEAGLRRVLIHSVKVDGNTETFLRLMNRVGGQAHLASFDDVDSSNPYSPSKDNSMDVLMRTAKKHNNKFSVKDAISMIYEAKGEAEGADKDGSVKMFGITRDAMLQVQDPDLIKRVEREVSSPIAKWLLGQIESGVSDEVIQSKVRNKYISEVKAFVKQLKREGKGVESLTRAGENGIQRRSIKVTPDMVIDASYTGLNNDALAMELSMRTQTKGAFCGTWGETSVADLLGGSSLLQELGSYTGISGGRVNFLGGGGGLRLSSGEKAEKCSKCDQHLCGKKSCCGMSY